MSAGIAMGMVNHGHRAGDAARDDGTAKKAMAKFRENWMMKAKAGG
jgi:hypothetical protein